MLKSYSNFIWLLIVPLLAFTPVFYMAKDNPNKSTFIKWTVQKSSTLRIQGSTNINTFGCDITGYYLSDTICCSEENTSSKLVTLKSELEIDTRKFDYHNKMLTSDLRKTLKADEYPGFVIRFLSLERAPVLHNNKDFLKGWVEIELAGHSKRFEVCYSFIKTGSSFIQLNGNRTFSFADFKLMPPNNLSGLIKFKDRSMLILTCYPIRWNKVWTVYQRQPFGKCLPVTFGAMVK